MKPKNMYIDPPEGWRYGFPKIIPAEHRGRATEWMIEQGYPEDKIKSYGDHFYCRQWYEEENESV